LIPPPFDKEKLLAMQIQISQGRMHPSISSPHNVMPKVGVPSGPVKRPVAEAWNSQRKKRRHETLELSMEEQQEVNKTLDTCLSCECHGFPCPQKNLA
jgi:hypothetical protein